MCSNGKCIFLNHVYLFLEYEITVRQGILSELSLSGGQGCLKCDCTKKTKNVLPKYVNGIWFK